ncbi:MAG: hypothetical protein FWD71_10735 [Oscillospiraceae bacterium]|nr:hypothetical protein [Oscillospiraceae bacterium]
MNSKLNKYANYLLENNPSPFCDYIISKELLKHDEQTVKGAYEWAKQFKLYKEIEQEQLPDGSWGGFDTAQTKIVKGKHYKATARAISRLLDLSLDGVDDPMVNKVIDVMKKYLSGELPDPEFYGKENTGKPIGIRRQIISNLGHFEPENAFVVELRNETAGRFKKCCEDGYFNGEIWRDLDILGTWSWGDIIMLSYGNVIDDNLQRMLLTHEWENNGWAIWNKPSDFKSPEDPWFLFWMCAVERLKNFSLFGEFMAKEITPYLYSICEKIVNDVGNQMNIVINNYFYHHGQYSESRNTVQKKKNDLLLQIIRILNKCQE